MPLPEGSCGDDQHDLRCHEDLAASLDAEPRLTGRAAGVYRCFFHLPTNCWRTLSSIRQFTFNNKACVDYSNSLPLFWCLISFSQGLWTRHNVSSTCSSPAPLHVCLPGPGPPPRLQSLPQHAGHRGVLLGGQQLLPGTASIHQDSSTYPSIPRLFSKRSSPTCGRSSPAGCWR